MRRRAWAPASAVGMGFVSCIILIEIYLTGTGNLPAPFMPDALDNNQPTGYPSIKASYGTIAENVSAGAKYYLAGVFHALFLPNHMACIRGPQARQDHCPIRSRARVDHISPPLIITFNRPILCR